MTHPPSADPSAGLTIAWSAVHHPEWDDAPAEYVAQGIVAWGRSRRLARAEDAHLAVKAYLGVQHDDPARWGQPGEARAVFFLSLFVAGRTVSLHTYPTLPAATAALAAFHARLAAARHRG